MSAEALLRAEPARSTLERVLGTRLGLNVPEGWWASAPMLKAVEAAEFAWVQLHAPPAAVLSVPRLCTSHASSVRATLETTGLRVVVHGPNQLTVGTRESDHEFEGLMLWCSEIGAEIVVYHARNLPDTPSSEQRTLFETRSLARFASVAERLGVTIAVENLAPTFPGPEPLSATPLALRGLVQRIGSERVGICLDVGHAHVIADMRHTTVDRLCNPVLDLVALFHLHDNLGARWDRSTTPGVDPLRLDLHLPPGRGNLPWDRMADSLLAHAAPLMLEIHPPYRPRTADLRRSIAELLAR